MRLGAKALAVLLWSTPVHAGDEQVVVIPLPKSPAAPRGDTVYCDGILTTNLKAVEKDYSRAIGRDSGVYASAHRATDRLIFQIFERELYMHRRDEFEAGKSKRRIPLKVIEDNASNLVAVDYGPIPGGTMVAVVMLNRATGIGIWTQAESVNLLASPHYPYAETIYLTCGARED